MSTTSSVNDQVKASEDPNSQTPPPEYPGPPQTTAAPEDSEE